MGPLVGTVCIVWRGEKWKKKSSKKKRKGRGVSRRMRKKKIRKGT